MLQMEGMLQLATTPFSLNVYLAIGYLRRTLDAGITPVRDAGGADLGLKRALEMGLVDGPRMLISITPLSITSGHLDFWLPSGQSLGLLTEHPGRPDGICDGVDAVRAKVREVLRAGAEVIKVCATGGVMSPTDHPDFTQFSPEELAVMVQEWSYRRGVKVMAHAQGKEGIKNALRAGVHSIEHGIYLDDEAIELMLARGTFLVPTLLAPQAVIEQAEARGTMPEWSLRKAKEVLEAHRDSIRRAHRAGGRDRDGHRRGGHAPRDQPPRARPHVRARGDDTHGVAGRHHPHGGRVSGLAGARGDARAWKARRRRGVHRGPAGRPRSARAVSDRAGGPGRAGGEGRASGGRESAPLRRRARCRPAIRFDVERSGGTGKRLNR